VRRRQFITLLGGAAVSWPLAARTQQSGMRTIGFLNSASSEAYAKLVAAFVRGLNDAGFVEGQNVAIEYRWADGHYERLPTLATDLIKRRVAVIAATGSANAAQAAMSATSTIPIVFANGSDPVKLGLVRNLSRPGGNATGVSFFHGEIGAKRFELLRELMPEGPIGFLVNPNNPVTNEDLTNIQQAARKMRVTITTFSARTANEIDDAFETLVQQHIAAVSINVDAFFYSRRAQLIALAARHKIPAMYYERTYVDAGGLMSYGSNNANFYRQAGTYVGMILNGSKPGDMPIALPTKFELVINLKTARALGLTVPTPLLATADEVIE
jgi:putative tryptophan/tyrosine transport system substrate-binding protein